MLPTYSTRVNLLALLVFAVCHVAAFDSGNIPSISAIEGNAFRHGDLEDVLGDVKRRPKKHFWNRQEYFDWLDVKRVYFGNWLRDYSQIIDVATLSHHVPRKGMTLAVALLAFKETGFATAEFQVTQERLGVYRADEHVDNPKGYPSDARTYDRQLRGPVDPRELEVDPITGLRNYMANDRGNWTTSTALMRKTITDSVRAYRAGNETDALRLLGKVLHTLEDWPAHTNFVELALAELGYRHVFPYIGELAAVKYSFVPMETGIWSTIKGHLPPWIPGIKQPGCYRPIYPVTTGTFGGMDALHSLLGMIKDKIQALEIKPLLKELQQEAQLERRDPMATLNTLIYLLRKFTNIDSEVEALIADIKATLAEIAKPIEINTQDGISDDAHEAFARFWKLIELRDRIMKRVQMFAHKIPGFIWIKEQISNLITRIVYSYIEALATPILMETIVALDKLSDMVTDMPDQQEIFRLPTSIDPTHSTMSKDHFNLHLNEPAGLVARVIVEHVADAVVTAWFDNSSKSLNAAIDLAVQVFHHPSANLTPKKSALQKDMLAVVKEWARSHLGAVASLDKVSVQAGWHQRVKDFDLDCSAAQKDLDVGVGYGWICGPDITSKTPPILPPRTVPTETEFRRCTKADNGDRANPTHGDVDGVDNDDEDDNDGRANPTHGDVDGVDNDDEDVNRGRANPTHGDVDGVDNDDEDDHGGRTQRYHYKHCRSYLYSCYNDHSVGAAFASHICDGGSEPWCQYLFSRH
ncbi:hypothetical protein HDU88_004007 [Geranomyces variabilis]|nr:hypothetical protein HDU88_004007 [Geranomyces variabilis]